MPSNAALVSFVSDPFEFSYEKLQFALTQPVALFLVSPVFFHSSIALYNELNIVQTGQHRFYKTLFTFS